MINEMAKGMFILGLVCVGMGLILSLLGKAPGLGRLPGDFLIKRENFTLYLPVTTGIILSLVVSLGVYLINRK